MTGAADNQALALALAGQDWRVFPCGSDKKPIIKSAHPKGDPLRGKCQGECGKDGHGFHDATNDPEKIKRWWKAHPGALVGIYCKGSGFFAVDVDIDPEKGTNGKATLEALINAHGGALLPSTPTQKTPRGGRHILFKHPADKIPNNAGVLGAGLDLRSEGYICTGTLPDGTGYRWIEGYSHTSPLAEAPTWLIEEIRIEEPRPAPSSNPAPTVGKNGGGRLPPGEYFLNKYLAEARPGNRNHIGFLLAEQLRDAGLSQAEAAAYMIQYTHGVPQPNGAEYTEAEALATLESAYSQPPRPAAQPGFGKPQPPQPEPTEPAPPDDWQADYDPGEPPEEPPAPGESASKPTAAPSSQAAYKTFADMAGEIGPIQFDWLGWVARGMLTMLAGESGKGKSLVAMRLCGCYLLGLHWPDGTPFTGETGKVLWCEAESAQALNLERATAWRYPLNKIVLPLPGALDDISLDNPDHRNKIMLAALDPEIKFIVIDSMSGSTRKKENDTEAKEGPEFLADLAKRTGKAILLTHHLNKAPFGASGEVTLDRVRGSSAIVQPCRVVIALDAPDRENKDNLRLNVIKSNLAKFPKPVGLTFGENAAPIFGAAPAPVVTESAESKANRFALDLVREGPIMAADAMQAFLDNGFPASSANDAKQATGILSKRVGKAWYWLLKGQEVIE